ncbi:MAG: hypothetical protein ACP5PS_04015 [Bacteroidales bacterium]
MHKYFLSAIGILIDFLVCRSYNNLSLSIASDASGGYAATAIGMWQVPGNQAGITHMQWPTLSVYYRQRFMLSELADKSIAFVYPARPAHLSLIWQNFGNTHYHENIVSIGTARKFGENFSVGLRFNRYQTYMNQHFNQRAMYNLDAGIISQLSKNFTLGGYIHSLIPEKVKPGQYSLLPTLMGLGGSYDIHPKVKLMSEFQLSTTSDYSWIGAMQMQPSDKMYLYTGLQIANNNTYSFSFGFLYNVSNYELGLALVQHYLLGITPSFQISYRFTRK